MKSRKMLSPTSSRGATQSPDQSLLQSGTPPIRRVERSAIWRDTTHGPRIVARGINWSLSLTLENYLDIVIDCWSLLDHFTVFFGGFMKVTTPRTSIAPPMIVCLKLYAVLSPLAIIAPRMSMPPPQIIRMMLRIFLVFIEVLLWTGNGISVARRQDGANHYSLLSPSIERCHWQLTVFFVSSSCGDTGISVASDHKATDHFTGAGKMVSTGSGSTRVSKLIRNSSVRINRTPPRQLTSFDDISHFFYICDILDIICHNNLHMDIDIL